MICSSISAAWRRLRSLFCALPLERQCDSNSGQVIVMPRLRMFRKKSSMQKRFAGRLQESRLQLVWVQDKRRSQKAARLQFNGIFQRKQEIPSIVDERPAATGTDDQDDYQICLKH